MQQTDIQKLKKLLETEKATLVTELSGLGVHDPQGGDWEATSPREEGEETESDENDLADRFEEYEERSATLNILKERFDDVENALARIANGTYGTCETCGTEIGEERLLANPAARTCTAHIND